MRLLLFNAFCAVLFTAGVCKESNIDSNSKSRVVPTFTISDLAQVLPKVPIDSIAVFDHSNVLAPYEVVTTSDQQYWVIADRFDNSIKLYNQKGTYLASTGVKGEGLVEIEGAKKLHIGIDDNLYVIDLESQRISVFEINEYGFTHTSSFSPSSSFTPGNQLKAIYVTEWGNFGVSRAIIDYDKGLEEFQFYKLDNEFNAIKKLFTMPGNDKITLDRWTHIDHILGQKTFWDFEGNSFYYINSHRTVINRYNVNTDSLQATEYFRLKDRKLDEGIKLEFMEAVSKVTSRSDKIHEAFVNKKYLSHFEGFTVFKNYYYLVIFNAISTNHSEIVRINRESGEMHYMNFPIHLWNIHAENQMLFGVDSSGKDSQMRVIHLKE